MKTSRLFILLAVIGLNGLLAAGGLNWLAAGLAPVQAQTESEPEPTAEAETPDAPLAAGTLVITNTYTPALVFNGGYITYTIAISNPPGSPAATNLQVFDTLPPNALDEATITYTVGGDPVQVVNVVTTTVIVPGVSEPQVATTTITVTRQISWTIPVLNGGQSQSLTLSGKVIGQPDGGLITNRAEVIYKQNLANAAGGSVVTARVRAAVPSTGQASISDAPNWLSADVGGTNSMDWGDFDRDGDLDLALGSVLGVTVYRNEAGRLVKFWNDEARTVDLEWLDFDIPYDGQLELVALDGVSALIRVYRLSGETFAADTRGSTFVLRNVEAADLGGGAVPVGVDLIGITDGAQPCYVVRLSDNGAGQRLSPTCLSERYTAALAAGDVNNGGSPDLLTGGSGSLFAFRGDVLTDTQVFTIGSASADPSGLALGDYDRDGFLDLAANIQDFFFDYCLNIPPFFVFDFYDHFHGLTDIYRSTITDTAVITFGAQASMVTAFPAPPNRPCNDGDFYVDVSFRRINAAWGDLNGDGWLDLFAVDQPPRVYLNPATGAFDSVADHQMSTPAQSEDVRVVEPSLRGGPVLALANIDDRSQLFDVFVPRLSRLRGPVAGLPAAGAVVWGDANADGWLDLLFGAGPPPGIDSVVRFNDGHGVFPPAQQLPFDAVGLGPHRVAFGDVNGDGELDLAIGATLDVRVFLAGQTTASWSAAPAPPNHRPAWGDANSDGRLDLLVASSDGPIVLYLNQGTALAATPQFTSTESGDVRGLAWADLDRDQYLDFAAAFYNGPAVIYRKEHDNAAFTPVWSSAVFSTTAVAWGDYDADGDADLAVGTEGQGVHLYENQSELAAGQFGAAPAWSITDVLTTTSLAWGDWNNDGYPELAVGNSGQPDRVYANLNSQRGDPRLIWLWTAAVSGATSGLAWGDSDRDGDLDLAASSEQAGQSGVYENTFITAAHLSNTAAQYLPAMPLPNNPLYVFVERPGRTADAYAYSSSDLLSGVIPITYRVYDPDDGRLSFSVPLAPISFTFSVDGGSTWYPATQAADSACPATPVTVTVATRTGAQGTFCWDAQSDATTFKAVGQDARFRVFAVPQDPHGPVQRAFGVGVSPPFQIRPTTCIWPQNPSITLTPSPNPTVPVRSPITFVGGLSAGSGVLTYTWDYDDGVTATRQVDVHTFNRSGVYAVKLTVTGQPCPVNRDIATTRLVLVGTGVPEIFLPVIRRSAASAAPASLGRSPRLSPRYRWPPADVWRSQAGALPLRRVRRRRV